MKFMLEGSEINENFENFVHLVGLSTADPLIYILLIGLLPRISHLAEVLDVH